MDIKQISVLIGKANPCTAKCCLIFELDDMLERHVRARENPGIVLPIILPINFCSISISLA
jgi:hypothetical protein